MPAVRKHYAVGSQAHLTSTQVEVIDFLEGFAHGLDTSWAIALKILK